MQVLTSALTARGIAIVGATDLYCLIKIKDARLLQNHLGKAGFWTRIFDDNPSWMRLGLPENDNHLKRFLTALDGFEHQ